MSVDVIVVVVGNRAVAVLLVGAILLAILLVGIIKVTVETVQDNLIGSIEAGQETAISMNHGLLMIADQL